MNEITQLIDSLTQLLGVLIWPGVVLLLMKRFEKPLSDFFANLGQVSISGGGLEATATRRKVEVAAAIGAAIASRPSDGLSPQQIVNDASEAAGEIVNSTDARSIRRIEGATVLWVDDNPDNNQYERRAMESMGVRFTLSLSTEEALSLTLKRSFDLIISDMGRPPDPRAGYSLLDALRSRKYQTPFIIYAGSSSIEHRTEARRHGAVDCTNNPRELIQLVLSTLGGIKRRGDLS